MIESALTAPLGIAAEQLEEDRVLVAAARKDSAAAGRLFDKYYSEVFATSTGARWTVASQKT
jgi:hypothetical protein